MKQALNLATLHIYKHPQKFISDVSFYSFSAKASLWA